MIYSKKDTIKHTGIVEKIDGEKCHVRILQSVACAGCAAHRLCNSSESKEKIVEASCNGEILRVGDSVEVEGTVMQGLQAVYICYVIPLVLIVACLFVGTHTWGELTGIVLSIIVMTAYYTVLYLFRMRIGKHFGFTVRQISNN